MRKKIICILVCMLLCVTVSAVTGTTNIKNEPIKEIAWLSSIRPSDCNMENQNSDIIQFGDWLHFDNGETTNSLGLTNGGTFEWAARFTPTELGAYSGEQITAVQYHHDWTSGPFDMDGAVKIYEEGSSTQPGGLISSEDFSAYENDWTLIELSDPVTIDGDEDIWVSIEGTHAAGQFPAGMDPGPAVAGKGDWVYLEGSGWQEIKDLGYNYNFNIWAGIGTGNEPPDTPSAPYGPSIGVIGVEYTFEATTTDPEGEDIYYWFEWGDGENSSWVGPYSSGTTGSAKHVWATAGDFPVTVKAKDINDRESGFSPASTITIVAGPLLDITKISGGFFKVNAKIKNIGTEDATNVQWTISLDGGTWINKVTTGTETTIPAGGEVDISSKLLLGWGDTKVTVTATIPEMTDSRTHTGFVYLIYVKVNPGSG